MAEMRDTVVLRHHNTYLETDSLNYDRLINMGYYFGGGEIFDVDNNLVSERGYYYSDDKDYYAVDSVVLVNPQYVMYADTLRYNTESEISYFYGPTRIISDSNFIYCENGYYDTQKDLSSFSENAYLINGNQILKGDSLFYDRNLHMGEAFVNVSVIDTTENMIAAGNYALYFESPQHALLTDSVLVTYVSDGDSIFLHSDTVLIDRDSADNKLIRAFSHVQVFKTDAQARCDSLVYCEKDSIAEMFGKPVIWAEGNQFTGVKMELHFVEKKAHHIIIDGNAFIVSSEDSLHYSQIKGRELFAYFKDNDIYRVDLFSDSQTLYYVRDEDTQELIGLNRVLSNDMIVYRNNKQVEKIHFFQKPDGALIPIEQLTPEESFLKDFRWLEEFRPQSKFAIFYWTPLE
jgi:lipopolysaccharide export system protein LptA